MQFAVMIASHNEHNISEIKDYASLSKCLDYALRHSKFMEMTSVYAMCLNSPEDTSLLIQRHIEEPVFVIREKKFDLPH